MTNTGKLNQEVLNLATLENSLWIAFKKTEKEGLPPKINVIKGWVKTKKLIKSNLLSSGAHYPFCVLFVIILAVAGYWSQWFLLVGGLYLWGAVNSWEKFAEAFGKSKLGSSYLGSYAFGIDHPSLMLAGMIDACNAQGVKLDQKSLQSILKILKASSEFSDVSIGIGDAVKKFLFSAPFVFVGWIYANAGSFDKYATAIKIISFTNQFTTLYSVLVVSGLLFICYDVILGQTFQKRRKKKYVLAVTLLAEGFVTEEISDRSIEST